MRATGFQKPMPLERGKSLQKIADICRTRMRGGAGGRVKSPPLADSAIFCLNMPWSNSRV
jgi:hypothetical protein